LWAASEALTLGYGGIAQVARATGIAPSTIGAGIRELRSAAQPGFRPDGSRRVRAPGAGRKPVAETDSELVHALNRLIDPVTRGDPESPLRWTSKAVRKLAEELNAEGHRVAATTVRKLLKGMGYSLKANRKTLEGKQHPDRDAQFQHIAKAVSEEQALGNPTISVDTKKKELVGNYKNAGREWEPKDKPVEVDCHDFMGELGRASPYGVYDMAHNEGWVSVGISADTAEFAVATVRRWWEAVGAQRHARATELLITADGGGSNGYQIWLWKHELQKLANELGKPIRVCHLPPGTSKWNKIEHRMFSFVTMNWRGRPLTDYQTIVELIGSTRTQGGLTVRCELDQRQYLRDRKLSKAQIAALNLTRDEFHGEWNYTLHPNK